MCWRSPWIVITSGCWRCLVGGGARHRAWGRLCSLWPSAVHTAPGWSQAASAGSEMVTSPAPSGCTVINQVCVEPSLTAATAVTVPPTVCSAWSFSAAAVTGSSRSKFSLSVNGVVPSWWAGSLAEECDRRCRRPLAQRRGAGGDGGVHLLFVGPQVGVGRPPVAARPGGVGDQALAGCELSVAQREREVRAGGAVRGHEEAVCELHDQHHPHRGAAQRQPPV